MDSHHQATLTIEWKSGKRFFFFFLRQQAVVLVPFSCFFFGGAGLAPVDALVFQDVFVGADRSPAAAHVPPEEALLGTVSPEGWSPRYSLDFHVTHTKTLLRWVDMATGGGTIWGTNTTNWYICCFVWVLLDILLFVYTFISCTVKVDIYMKLLLAHCTGTLVALWLSVYHVSWGCTTGVWILPEPLTYMSSPHFLCPYSLVCLKWSRIDLLSNASLKMYVQGFLGQCAQVFSI